MEPPNCAILDLFISGVPFPEVQPTAETAGQPSLLYTSKPTAEFRLRPLEQQHDRQTVYINAYLAGALDALVQLVADGNKTRLVDEKVRNLLAKYKPRQRLLHIYLSYPLD